MIPRTDSGQLKQTIEDTILQHTVITNSDYCRWFRSAGLSHAEVKGFVQQFSVFSNLSSLALLNHVINTGSTESAREAKQILLNELGVLRTRRSRRILSRCRRGERSVSSGS